jgi:hypothetical protein
MRFVSLSAVGVSSVILLACAPKLSAAGANIVYVRSAADVAGCAKLGTVEAGNFAQTTGDDPQAQARNDMRNKAADMGGTHILVDEGPGGLMKATSADVYKCDKAAPPGASGAPSSSS